MRKSLFIQVQWYNPTRLAADLEHVYQAHRNRNADDYIYNVVLDEIGDVTGLSPNLDIILPYLPGGAKRAFDNVFVGSHFVPWQGAGTAYREGMLDGAHRWRNLDVQRAVWEQFKTKYSQIPYHFYINHEGVLNYLSDRSVANAYEAYLIQTTRDAQAVKPYAALLWSPAVWSRRPFSWRQRKAIARVFSSVAKYSKTKGITWLHLQDMQGRKKPPPLWVVVSWYRWLKQLPFASMRINLELFKQKAGGGIEAALPAAIIKREAYYERKHVVAGASWSLRWWVDSHNDK